MGFQHVEISRNRLNLASLVYLPNKELQQAATQSFLCLRKRFNGCNKQSFYKIVGEGWLLAPTILSTRTQVHLTPPPPPARARMDTGLCCNRLRYPNLLVVSVQILPFWRSWLQPPNPGSSLDQVPQTRGHQQHIPWGQVLRAPKEPNPGVLCDINLVKVGWCNQFIPCCSPCDWQIVKNLS